MADGSIVDELLEVLNRRLPDFGERDSLHTGLGLIAASQFMGMVLSVYRLQSVSDYEEATSLSRIIAEQAVARCLDASQEEPDGLKAYIDLEEERAKRREKGDRHG